MPPEEGTSGSWGVNPRKGAEMLSFLACKVRLHLCTAVDELVRRYETGIDVSEGCLPSATIDIFDNHRSWCIALSKRQFHTTSMPLDP